MYSQPESEQPPIQPVYNGPRLSAFPSRSRAKHGRLRLPVDKGMDAHVSLLTQHCRGSKASMTKREGAERKERREQQKEQVKGDEKKRIQI